MATFPIVTVNTSITTAPQPNSLQQRGALVSQGGTSLSPGTTQQIASPADLAAIAALPVVNANLVWADSVVTVTTATPHGWTIGDNVKVTVAGVAPVGYNGVVVATIVNASTFTYPLASNPGSETTPGTSTL